jgi:beta-mannosidase
MRVWGGGIWEPRAFFDACDELGVLLYVDLQFGAKKNYSMPNDTNYKHVVPAELEYQIKRTGPHPSIAMWDGCNEW